CRGLLSRTALDTSCVLVFFFSSRRRHTRFSRDWSSDVCSSDLDDEFEALLDQLHGKGRHTGVAADAAPAAEPVAAEAPAGAGGDDLISDSEFEELLDRLHGKGKHSAAAGADAAATAESVTAEPAADKPRSEEHTAELQ